MVGDTPTRPVPRRVAATAPSHSMNSPVRTERTRTRHARMPDACIGHRTPDVDMGHWTLDTGHPHRTSDTGRATPGRADPDRRTLDTHRTPDAGRVDAGQADADGRHGQGDQGTVGVRTSWAARRRWDAKACCCGRHARRSATMTARREATCQSARLPAALQAAAGSLRRRPSSASAHCSPRKDSGRA
jgi:hypothetical protein